MLSRNPEGRLCLEDGEGRVPLDMEDAVSGSVFEVNDAHMPGSRRRHVYRRMFGPDRGGIYNRRDSQGACYGSSAE
jgi:hypothetical protein